MSNITKLYLLNVPLEADYKHTLYFKTKSEQETYFLNQVVGTKHTDFSYQRKDNKIRMPKHFDEIAGKVNYVMYQNTAYSGKWFYAFITDIKYISDGVTEVYIKTDVIQSWFFDYIVKSCFVEREHTKDDTVGKNTVPEGLETGEYICNKTIHDRSMESTCYIVASAVNLDSGSDSGLNIYNNVINGWYYYYFETEDELSKKLKNLAELRTNDAIVSIFVMPSKYIFKGNNNMVIHNLIPSYHFWPYDGDDSSEPIYKPESIDGYSPHNKKLLTYPYTYLLMDNNAGASVIYHYELFKDSDPLRPNICTFKIYGAITPSGSIRLLPLKYAGVDGENNNYGLTAGKFPVCGWQSDYYTNWLTQNALNIQVQTESIKLASQQQLVNDVSSSVSSGIKGDVGGVISGLAGSYFNAKNYLNQIQGITAQKEIHAFQSPTVSGNVNSGDVNFVSGKNRFSAYQMSIKEEYAKIIDGYFSMYGYQTNRVKVPNKNHRSSYWYTKTVGCEIDGPIPNADLQIIKSCYDNGITFWRRPNEIGRYTDDAGNLKQNIIE